MKKLSLLKRILVAVVAIGLLSLAAYLNGNFDQFKGSYGDADDQDKVVTHVMDHVGGEEEASEDTTILAMILSVDSEDSDYELDMDELVLRLESDNDAILDDIDGEMLMVYANTRDEDGYSGREKIGTGRFDYIDDDEAEAEINGYDEVTIEAGYNSVITFVFNTEDTLDFDGDAEIQAQLENEDGDVIAVGQEFELFD